MDKLPSSEEILAKATDFLQTQGVDNEGQPSTPEEKMAQIMEALTKARNTQSALYSWEPPSGGGLARKVKNTIQLKLKNIILNALEKYVARQQKFNEIAYQAIVALHEENLHLTEKLKQTSDGD
jgi:hypothetical protein